MVTLTETAYRDKVLGGWLGTLLGAALGAPLDGQKQSHDLDQNHLDSFSRSHPSPNATTDFELAWLRALQTVGPRITSEDLSAAWLKYLCYASGEYAYAARNLRRDLHPPVSGAFDNPFQHALGALSRASIWGLVSPGDPRQAACYARQDAMLDHAGPGVEAACVVAALVSAAFAESDAARLLETAIGLLPGESRVARAIRDTLRWHGELAQWSRTREMLLRAYGADDVRDAVVAVAFIALALMHDRGDLGRALLTAARCGWSTATTCGAVGAVLGVALGASALPARLRDLVVDEVQAGWGVVGVAAFIPITQLADQTADIGQSVIRTELAGRVQLTEGPTEERSALAVADPSGLVRQMAMGPYVTVLRRGPLEVHIDYDGRCTIGYDAPRKLMIEVTNTGPRSVDLRTRISAPFGFIVTTNSDRVTVPEGASVSFSATVAAPEEHARIGGANPCTLFVSLDDAGELMFPISLIGESLWYAAGPYGSFDESHAPERPGILSGEIALGGEGWRRLSVSEPAVNIAAGLEGEVGTYYLATDYWAPRARAARLRVGCNDGVKVWMGGGEVLSQHEHRPVSPLSADECEVDLWQGWNRVVVKMAQCSPRRFLSVVWKIPDQQILLEAVNTFPRS